MTTDTALRQPPKSTPIGEATLERPGITAVICPCPSRRKRTPRHVHGLGAAGERYSARLSHCREETRPYRHVVAPGAQP